MTVIHLDIDEKKSDSHYTGESHVVLFPKHKLYKCNCGSGACQYCGGGLSYCVTCGGFEGAMPEDCPQVLMTQSQFDLVYEGTVDFRRKLGGWTSWTRTKEMRVRGLLS